MSTLFVDSIQPKTTGSQLTIAPAIQTGAMLQTQFTQYTGTTTVSTSADTNAEISVLTVNITPKSTSSIIKLDAHIFHEWSDQGDATNSVWFFYRDSTLLKAPSAGSRPCGISMSTLSHHTTDAGSTPEIAYYSYFDAPNTINQITYKVGVLPRYTRTIYINRTVTDNDNNSHERGVSFISATEIGG